MIEFEMRVSMRGVSTKQALSDKELDQLSDFLKNIGPSALSLEAVDGLFCALILRPGVGAAKRVFAGNLGRRLRL
jgi:hypothetical protein